VRTSFFIAHHSYHPSHHAPISLSFLSTAITIRTQTPPSIPSTMPTRTRRDNTTGRFRRWHDPLRADAAVAFTDAFGEAQAQAQHDQPEEEVDDNSDDEFPAPTQPFSPTMITTMAQPTYVMTIH
jgi:hypothetical protein